MNLLNAYRALLAFRNTYAERYGRVNNNEIRGIDIALEFLNDLIDAEIDEMAEDYYKGD